MTAIDTNFLVRFLVKDDPKQARTVYNILKEIETEKNTLHIPVIVIIELIWVLEAAYDISRDEIINSLDQLLLMPIFTFENLSSIQQTIREAVGTKYDLADLFIANSAKQSGCTTVLTFDKKASKHPMFTLL